ncbi:hypothetical protein D4764_05G0001100 [Takifugu flavidus]|uniref:Uncharacterized protein n=1 Tax=Takifugu flavidus TaxID=433684 RepID=A0A5C6N2V2_9TELE|nr:hypothetical protein D4764_05G0001100 [Takifugu flavidus]
MVQMRRGRERDEKQMGGGGSSATGREELGPSLAHSHSADEMPQRGKRTPEMEGRNCGGTPKRKERRIGGEVNGEDKEVEEGGERRKQRLKDDKEGEKSCLATSPLSCPPPPPPPPPPHSPNTCASGSSSRRGSAEPMCCGPHNEDVQRLTLLE